MISMYLAMERELLVVQQHHSSWRVESRLIGMQPKSIAVDPHQPERVYCGTFGRGLWRSEDAGITWVPIGDPGHSMEPYDGTGIPSALVTAVAVSPTEHAHGRGVVYAGTEPTALFRSEDAGETWHELTTIKDLPSAPTWAFPPRPHTHHVQWITPDPHQPGRIFVAIERGTLARSFDYGEHWEDNQPDGPLDTHILLTHSLVPHRLYSAAGDGFRSPGRGYNESYDGGNTWHRPNEGLHHNYLWSMAVDPADPEVIVVAAAPSPQKAHHDLHDPYSTLYRKTTAHGVWQEVTAGLPSQRGLVIPTLESNPDELHVFYTLTNRGLYRSQDAGESWTQLPIPWREHYFTQHHHVLVVRSL